MRLTQHVGRHQSRKEKQQQGFVILLYERMAKQSGVETPTYT